MPRLVKTVPSYSHVGCCPEVGYEHRGRKNSHHSLRDAGKTHALTVTPRGQYGSLCGVDVPRYSDSVYGDGSTTGHVAPAEGQGGEGVCCGRCRKILGVQVYAVQARDYKGAWYPVLGGKFAKKADAVEFMKDCADRMPGQPVRVRIV